MKVNYSEMSLAELENFVQDAVKALSKRSFQLGFADGVKAEKKIYKRTKPISPQQQRDAIVEQAKKDVAELSTTRRRGCKSLEYGLCTFSPKSETVNFEVNREKRTVVCYITHKYEGKTYTGYRGIAKCAPSDCFNAHIGKAIALRRALGLRVPRVYLNAPQPTEVRVGDVVQWKGQGDYRYVINAKQPNNLYGFLDADNGMDCGILRYVNLTEIATVIDDTRGVDVE